MVAKMSGITTHILDTSLGRPASGVQVTLEFANGENWAKIGSGTTNQDGRTEPLVNECQKGTYRISFEVGEYFRKSKTSAFYPSVQIQFRVENPGEHFHVPLLLNPYGYSTYRGS